MENDDKKTLKIVLAVFGCLGCAGLVLIGAFLGLGFWVSSTSLPAPPPLIPTGPITPPGPIAPATPNFAPTQPAGWSSYAHSVQCPNNNNLRLAQFRAAYPANYKVLACQEQEPRPWSYVTFHLEDQAGAADKQITLGYARGLPNQQILESVAAQLVGQLGGPFPRLLDATPLAARGGGLLRRDSAFTVPATLGTFAPGSYVMRQVVAPGQGLGGEGIMVTLVQRVRTTEAAAILESNPVLLQAVNSIQY